MKRKKKKVEPEGKTLREVFAEEEADTPPVVLKPKVYHCADCGADSEIHAGNCTFCGSNDIREV